MPQLNYSSPSSIRNLSLQPWLRPQQACYNATSLVVGTGVLLSHWNKKKNWKHQEKGELYQKQREDKVKLYGTRYVLCLIVHNFITEYKLQEKIIVSTSEYWLTLIFVCKKMLEIYIVGEVPSDYFCLHI
jgi:hypothetical protein